jgi:hypothetical protein
MPMRSNASMTATPVRTLAGSMNGTTEILFQGGRQHRTAMLSMADHTVDVGFAGLLSHFKPNRDTV